MLNVLTVSGIRPDFVRMSSVFKKLDASEKINHILVHTGQHFNQMLSDVFFQELNIRQPDFNLGCGKKGQPAYITSSKVTIALLDLIYAQNLQPDLIVFLGDSNSVTCAVELKKAGFRIAHIEAGMRSYDRRMLEETNRIVCDHCSDLHFVYHPDYMLNLLEEAIPDKGIHIVGNTIVEVCSPLTPPIFATKKSGDFILMDIHRPENFHSRERLQKILEYANYCSFEFSVPVKFVKFGRTVQAIQDFDLSLGERIQAVNLMSYKEFLSAQYNSLFMISDSGTAQEEPALLNTPVIVPREFTERPQSMDADCSYLLKDLDSPWSESLSWLDDIIGGVRQIDSSWLGDGSTATKIVEIIENLEK